MRRHVSWEVRWFLTTVVVCMLAMVWIYIEELDRQVLCAEIDAFEQKFQGGNEINAVMAQFNAHLLRHEHRCLGGS